MTDGKKQQGIGSEAQDFEVQEETQTKGGQASMGQDQDFDQTEESQEDSGTSGLGVMKEEGRGEEVSESSVGGSSYDGGRNQDEE